MSSLPAHLFRADRYTATEGNVDTPELKNDWRWGHVRVLTFEQFFTRVSLTIQSVVAFSCTMRKRKKENKTIAYPQQLLSEPKDS